MPACVMCHLYCEPGIEQQIKVLSISEERNTNDHILITYLLCTFCSGVPSAECDNVAAHILENIASLCESGVSGYHSFTCLLQFSKTTRLLDVSLSQNFASVTDVSPACFTSLLLSVPITRTQLPVVHVYSQIITVEPDLILM